jgi:hypothetical protein
MLKECGKQCYRFLTERNPEAPLEELAGSDINLIAIEADNAGHGPAPALPFPGSVPAGEDPAEGKQREFIVVRGKEKMGHK